VETLYSQDQICVPMVPKPTPTAACAAQPSGKNSGFGVFLVLATLLTFSLSVRKAHAMKS